MRPELENTLKPPTASYPNLSNIVRISVKGRRFRSELAQPQFGNTYDANSGGDTVADWADG